MWRKKKWEITPDDITGIRVGSEIIPAEEIEDITWDGDPYTCDAQRMTVKYTERCGNIEKKIEAIGAPWDFEFYGCEVEE